MKNQLTKGDKRRVIYIENKDGDIDGYTARIGWVTFSKSGRSIYYRNRTLKALKGGGTAGNYYCEETGQEYWVSAVKKRDSNTHWAESVQVHIDTDAAHEYEAITNGNA